MKKSILTLLLLCSTCIAHETIKTAVLGLGGRAQSLLLECLSLRDDTQKQIQIVAVCDDHAFACLNEFSKRLGFSTRAHNYKKMFSGCSYYPDTTDGLKKLFEKHPDLDRILITSANYRHLDHINSALEHSSCQNIFIEKPLFRNLDEFNSFASKTDQRQISVGLTLRYSNMTRIVSNTLKKHQNKLGKLKKIKAWEHVGFAHAMTMIMMNWRRYQSLSGGLLIEKSVHDLDLALTFMRAANAIPEHLSITTESGHKLFKKSNHKMLLDFLSNNRDFAHNVAAWDTIPWQRTIPFSYNKSDSVDWKTTLENFFAAFPKNDDFSNSDIIPDEQKLTSSITTTAGDSIDFELDVTLSSGNLAQKRGVHMTFENGEALIDVTYGVMRLKQNGKKPIQIDLQSGGRAHAGGDLYVAHTILDTLPKGQHKALIHDPAVQLSSLMGLISEHQAVKHQSSPIQLTQIDNHWKIDFPTNK